MTATAAPRAESLRPHFRTPCGDVVAVARCAVPKSDGRDSGTRKAGPNPPSSMLLTGDSQNRCVDRMAPSRMRDPTGAGSPLGVDRRSGPYRSIDIVAPGIRCPFGWPVEPPSPPASVRRCPGTRQSAHPASSPIPLRPQADVAMMENSDEDRPEARRGMAIRTNEFP